MTPFLAKIDALLRRHDAPVYCYDLDEFDRAIGVLRSGLPAASRLYYSVKSNPHRRLIEAAVHRGCRIEISSTGELERSIEAGVDPAAILVTGPGKTDGFIAACIDAGVSLFSAESRSELQRLDAAAGANDLSVTALLRCNLVGGALRAGLQMMGKPSQFGIDIDQIRADARAFLRWSNLEVVGLHYYMASNFRSAEDLFRQFSDTAHLARTLSAEIGLDLALLDLGGGFPAPYAVPGEATLPGDLAPRLSALLDHVFSGWPASGPEVIFEAGRAISASCGTLFLRVVDVKRCGDRNFIVLNGGINTIGGIGAVNRMLRPRFALIHHRLGPAAGPTMEYTVCGPLCTPLDTLVDSATFSALSVGDILSISNVGAYGLSASMLGFLSHPHAIEVMTRGDRIAADRRHDEVCEKSLEIS
jgi:diaminopimelate decarboxylase